MRNTWREPYHVIVEIENKVCKIQKKLKSFGLEKVKVIDIRASSSGSVKHLVELDSSQIKKMPKEETNQLRLKGNEDRVSIWFESEGCDICNTLLSHGSFLIAGNNIQSSAVVYSFIAPNFEAYRDILSVLENAGFKTKLVRVGKFEPKAKVLTDKQEKVFWLALKTGFFDYPRKIDTIALSHKLGVRPSTLSETIRRGTRRLVEQFFET